MFLQFEDLCHSTETVKAFEGIQSSEPDPKGKITDY